MTQRSIDLIFRGRDQVSGVTRKIAGELRSMVGGVLSVAGGNLLSGAINGIINQGVRAARSGVSAVAGFVSESISAFQEAEQIDRKLATSLELIGINSAAALPRLQAFSSEVQKATVLDDEFVRSLATIGVNIAKVSGPALEQLTTGAIGLAEKLGIDAKTAMELLSRAAAGGTVAWSRYGIVVDKSVSAQENFNRVLKSGVEAFALAQARADTSAGRFQQFRNRIDDIKQEIGGALLPVMNALGDAVSHVVTRLETAGSALTDFIGSIDLRQLSDFVGTMLVRGFDLAVDAAQRLWKVIQDIVQSVRDFSQFDQTTGGMFDRLVTAAQVAAIKVRQSFLDAFAEIRGGAIKQLVEVSPFFAGTAFDIRQQGMFKGLTSVTSNEQRAAMIDQIVGDLKSANASQSFMDINRILIGAQTRMAQEALRDRMMQFMENLLGVPGLFTGSGSVVAAGVVGSARPSFNPSAVPVLPPETPERSRARVREQRLSAFESRFLTQAPGVDSQLQTERNTRTVADNAAPTREAAERTADAVEKLATQGISLDLEVQEFGVE